MLWCFASVVNFLSLLSDLYTGCSPDTRRRRRAVAARMRDAASVHHIPSELFCLSADVTSQDFELSIRMWAGGWQTARMAGKEPGGRVFQPARQSALSLVGTAAARLRRMQRLVRRRPDLRDPL